MSAYYNEHDKKAAAWLRELIRAGHLPQGEVDERSIEDVKPSDLAGFRQCHFFAGIGGWPLALRLAGWPDDAEVWSGSCPCQPFSSAGKGAGFADERHLWPAFHWLIRQRLPGVVLGEQVASAYGIAWLDLVQADLEAEGYAVGATVFPACGIGAPHMRQRTYWLAVAAGQGCGQRREDIAGRAGGNEMEGKINFGQSAGHGDDFSQLDNTLCDGCKPGRGDNAEHERIEPDATVENGWLADGESAGLERHARHGDGSGESGRQQADAAGSVAEGCAPGHPSEVNGFWRAADWLFCRDGKWRPVEPGSFPLADGVPARVVRLLGYGNAIVIPQAVEFIRAAMHTLGSNEIWGKI